MHFLVVLPCVTHDNPSYMSVFSSLLRSVVLTSIISFVAATGLIGLVTGIILSVGYVPGLSSFSALGLHQVATILIIFGSGNPLVGLVLIGLVCSLVAVLFDVYTSYRNQTLNR
jgi:hypothetical protein